MKNQLIRKVTRLSAVLLFAFAMTATLPGCACKSCGPAVAKKCCGKCKKGCPKKKCGPNCTKPCCKKT